MSTFIEVFQPGDKVYGLAGNGLGRDKYIHTAPFLEKFGSLNFTTDQMNNKFLGTGFLDGPTIYYSNQMFGIEECGYGLVSNLTAAQTDEADAYRRFLENHEKIKYRPQRCPSEEQRNVRISRACKAAIEFTSMVCNRRIHFILDDINIADVMSKTPTVNGTKSITGQELRFIYRSSVKITFDTPHITRPKKEKKLVVKPWFAERMASRGSGSGHPIMKLLNDLKIHNTYESVRYTHDILSKITFWAQGEMVEPPWEGTFAKQIWYGFYGGDYDNKIEEEKRKCGSAVRAVKDGTEKRAADRKLKMERKGRRYRQRAEPMEM